MAATEPEINERLDSLARSMTEAALSSQGMSPKYYWCGVHTNVEMCILLVWCAYKCRDVYITGVVCIQM